MENIVLVPTPDIRAGRRVVQSLHRLADDELIEVRAAVVVERHPDGRWHFPAETETVSYGGTITGGALGALIGLLAGPAGVLLGGAAGLLIGSSVEVGDTEKVETIVHALPRLVPPGSTAVIADVYETGPAEIDGTLRAHGATAWRMTRNEAEAQIEGALRRLDESER